MVQTQLRIVVLICLGGWLAATPSLGADRTADKILADINAIDVPDVDSKEKAEVAKRQKAIDQKAKLILELYKTAPTNPELVKLMPERWKSRPATTASALTTKAEVEEILLKNKNPNLVAEAAFYKVKLALQKAGSNPKLADVLPTIDDFAKRFPKDERVGELLYQLASNLSDKTKQAEIYGRIQSEFPESEIAKKIEARVKQFGIIGNAKDMIGKPFVLSFSDAIKGSEVSIEGLKGKVVVIDFWATWCGPCVAEMPNMKKLYAEYKDKGVEFIGVSLDQPKEKGGLDALKAFVEKNKIEWPQYYQGNFWQSDFSSAWHINSIPCVFLVDAEGNLASVDARGKLEKLLPQYLGKKEPMTKAEGGSKKTQTVSGPTAN
jgi:thiol-disulfide isomerase/thioredoxin